MIITRKNCYNNFVGKCCSAYHTVTIVLCFTILCICFLGFKYYQYKMRKRLFLKYRIRYEVLFTFQYTISNDYKDRLKNIKEFAYANNVLCSELNGLCYYQSYFSNTNERVHIIFYFIVKNKIEFLIYIEKVYKFDICNLISKNRKVYLIKKLTNIISEFQDFLLELRHDKNKLDKYKFLVFQYRFYQNLLMITAEIERVLRIKFKNNVTKRHYINEMGRNTRSFKCIINNFKFFETENIEIFQVANLKEPKNISMKQFDLFINSHFEQMIQIYENI